MKEVALELEGLLRANDVHPWGRQESDNLQECEYLLGDFHASYPETEPISTTTRDDTKLLVPLNIEDGR